MVKRCQWGLCNSDSRYPERLEGDIFFIPFPKPKRSLDKCLRWIKACGRPHEQLNVNVVDGNYHMFVCSKHFPEGKPTDRFPDPEQATPATGQGCTPARPPPKRRSDSEPPAFRKKRKILLELDTSAVDENRQTILSGTTTDSYTLNCTSGNEIKSLIIKVCEKNQDVSRTKEEAEQEIRNLESKLQKVQEYGESVEQFEQSTSEVYLELQKTTQEVEELKERKFVIDKDPEETERLLSGVVEKELQSEIEHLKSQLLQAGTEAKLNVTKLTEERQKHKQLSQTIQVLHKRNAAQLTRLKRQVKELQTRNRQKQAQLSQLETNMVQAEKQLTQ